MNSKETDVFVPKTRNNRSSVKSFLAQLFAAIGFGLMILSVGSLLTVPTVIVGALYRSNSTSDPFQTQDVNNTLVGDSWSNQTGEQFWTSTDTTEVWTELPRHANHSETMEEPDMELTEMQASWLGSITYMAQPVGSIASGFIQKHIGRRNGMMATSVVQLVGWLALYFSKNPASLLSATVLLGLSIGFMEAPGLSYIGEVIEPRYRGSLTNVSMNMWLFGFLFEYLVGAMMHWRIVCLVSAAIPVVNLLVLCVLPESPTFLLLKGRERQAEASLRWLRGWAKHEDIKEEYQALVESLNIPNKHIGTYLTPVSVMLQNGLDQKQKRSKSQLESLRERRVLIPLLLIAMFFFTQHCLALAGPKPFLINIFDSLNLTLPSRWTLVCAGLLQLLGVAACAALIQYSGKRKLIMASGISSLVLCLLISLYLYVRPGLPIIPLILFALTFFCNGLGIMSIPWCLIAEVFPTECKGVAAGIAAACSYVLGFFVTITFIHLESVVELWGCFLTYGIIGAIGISILYYHLPETEGKTLDEVQLLFLKKDRKGVTKPPRGHNY